MALSRAQYIFSRPEAGSTTSEPTEPGEPGGTPGIHSFTGLPYDEYGWTDFEEMTSTGYEDARVVFVSATDGDDATGATYGIEDVTFDAFGMFQASGTPNAYATIAAANAQLRTGYPDILLLNRGDTWNERFSSTSAGRVYDGRSQTERKIVASYGSGDRPVLHNNTGVTFDNDSASYILVSGLYMYADDWTVSDRAFDIRGYSTDILVEDCKVVDQVNIVQGGDLYRIGFRRCSFAGGEAHDGQFYTYGTDGLLFEENLFQRPFDYSYPDESRYGRFFYMNPGDGIDLHNLKNVEVTRNIFYDAEREALDYRGGGSITDNLIIGADTYMGGRGGSDGSVVSGSFENNVFTQTSSNIRNISSVRVINADGVTISGNIFTDIGDATGAYTQAVNLQGSVSFQDVTASENVIYGWHGGAAEVYGIFTDSGVTTGTVARFVVSDNELQMVDGTNGLLAVRDDLLPYSTFSGNSYYSSSPESDWFFQGDHDAWVAESGETGSTDVPITYSDPDRTVVSYNASLGGIETIDAFIATRDALSRQDWSSAYGANAVNNYIRAGFDKAAVEVTY